MLKPLRDLSIRMTMRFEGLTSSQVDALHRAVEEVRTSTKTCGGLVHEEGDTVSFAVISKSNLKGEGGRYAVIVTVHPALAGWVWPPLEGRDRRWAEVHPSRNVLAPIFDAVGILPEEETVEDRPIPPEYGGGGSPYLG